MQRQCTQIFWIEPRCENRHGKLLKLHIYSISKFKHNFKRWHKYFQWPNVYWQRHDCYKTSGHNFSSFNFDKQYFLQRRLPWSKLNFQSSLPINNLKQTLTMQIIEHWKRREVFTIRRCFIWIKISNRRQIKLW